MESDRYSNFYMVKRTRGQRDQFYVAHSRNPRFTIKIDPDYNPHGKPGLGFIKSIRLSNSWTADYHLCLRLVNEAENFFRLSMQAESEHG
ncbi:MAG TPA: hypothetical protein VK041_07570 [Opitutales bacterium]|nr:hypothetical protein [Opitutales bacterium]